MFEDWINDDIKNVLLVEPDFPIPTKSRNHKNFLPIGLLKIASFLREKNINVKLVRHGFDNEINEGLKNNITLFNFGEKKNVRGPDLICISSLFTYWSKYVKEAVLFYKKLFPDAPVLVGGIYASLMPEHCKEYTGCDDVIIGQIQKAERFIPAYDLVDVDYQIIHTTRGCIRRCEACGVYNIEPKWFSKESIKNEIVKKNIVFYDNNLLANKFIENILQELIDLKKEKKIRTLESQSGFDGRILIKKPYLATMLKEAGFKFPKIAWDGELAEKEDINKQIKVLVDAGFHAKDISVFMLYNHELDYNELEAKRVECFKMGVQITDCRFRPLNLHYDNYSPAKRNGQTSRDYFIHKKWSDKAIRKFRRNVRRHNICVRHEVDYHSALLERKKIPKDLAGELRTLSYNQVDKKILPDAWTPSIFHDVNEQDYFVFKR